MRRHIVAAAQASAPKGCQVLLTLLRRVRAARRVLPDRMLDCVAAPATAAKADANLRSPEKEACGHPCLVNTEARLRQPAAIEAP